MRFFYFRKHEGYRSRSYKIFAHSAQIIKTADISKVNSVTICTTWTLVTVNTIKNLDIL